MLTILYKRNVFFIAFIQVFETATELFRRIYLHNVRVLLVVIQENSFELDPDI